MSQTRPPVCVLIPAWKDQQGLTKTLEVLGQEPFPYDIVVVDDGSPTPLVAAPRYGNHEVTFERLAENQGIEHALNRGLEIIFERGYRYIARLDCADVPISDRIEKQATFLDAHPDVGMVGSWVRCIDDNGDYLFTINFPAEHEEITRRQRYVPGLLHPGILMRSDALRDVGVYSGRYRTAEDYDLFVRMGQKYRLANIPEVLTVYVVSATGTTAAKRRFNLISRLRIQLANFSFTDLHSYFGVLRTLVFILIPFNWLIAVKQRLWK